MICLVLVKLNFVRTKMIMDQTSCQEVEGEECGVCHTVYMPECEMKMVEEMMPRIVNMCKNMTKYEERCNTTMETKEVEERTPECKLELMDQHHKICSYESDQVGCKKVMRCHLTTQMKKKQIPNTICENVAMEDKEERCFDMIQLKKEMHEKKSCTFHPKTICHDSDGRECKKVRKIMCNYIEIDTNHL